MKHTTPVVIMDYKISAVNYCLENKDSVRKTCKIFVIVNKSTLQRWDTNIQTDKNKNLT